MNEENDCGQRESTDIKLLENEMKSMENVFEKWLISIVKIDDIIFGPMPGNVAIDAVWTWRKIQLQKHWLEQWLEYI